MIIAVINEITFFLVGVIMSIINIFSKTDVGIKRDQNEDSIRTLQVMSGGLDGESRHYALILADGMGGYAKGEVASRIACDGFAQFSILGLPAIFEGDNTPSEIRKRFEKSVAETLNNVNEEIWNLSEGGKMGCTLVYEVIYDDHLYLAHVGDSRAYMVKKGEIEQITKDHSYVNALLDNNAITEEEAEEHPMRHVITKSVGTTEKVTADYNLFNLNENVNLLMCSDGLTDMLRDNEIRDIILNNNPAQICQKLVDGANEKGGKDNISVILARITSGGKKRTVMKPIRVSS